MYKLKSNRTKQITELILYGDLTIRTAAELKEGFLKAIAKKKDILIDLSDGEEFDFAFLQLLISFDKTIADGNLKVTIKNKLNQSYADLIHNSGMAGYSRLFASSLLESEGGNNG